MPNIGYGKCPSPIFEGRAPFGCVTAERGDQLGGSRNLERPTALGGVKRCAEYTASVGARDVGAGVGGIPPSTRSTRLTIQ